jgi:hypothetical protein
MIHELSHELVFSSWKVAYCTACTIYYPVPVHFAGTLHYPFQATGVVHKPVISLIAGTIHHYILVLHHRCNHHPVLVPCQRHNSLSCSGPALQAQFTILSHSPPEAYCTILSILCNRCSSHQFTILYVLSLNTCTTSKLIMYAAGGLYRQSCSYPTPQAQQQFKLSCCQHSSAKRTIHYPITCHWCHSHSQSFPQLCLNQGEAIIS